MTTYPIDTDNSQPWLCFKRPFVRDLAFALSCPDALTHWIAADPNIVSLPIAVHDPIFWQTQYINYMDRLHVLDNSSTYQELTRYLMSRPSPYRLGFHFEGLIHFWLEDGYKLGIHPYEVIAHNVQLYSGTQTTGELDFILLNHEIDEVEHWELAIKFYLGNAPYDKFENWIGINARDTLQRKLIHMQSKPFRSLSIDLDFYHKIKIDKRYMVMKGRFFKDSKCDDPNPCWLNPNFPIHRWYSIKSQQDFEALQMPELRSAHYIEWLTQRPFYDAKFLMQSTVTTLDPHLNKDELRRRRNRLARWPYVPLQFEDIETNLYLNHGEPVVLVRNT
ncbi:DUF1853 family protein [Psychrobacter sp.]|uniref:DUF1853 family protein n=1 Tax=Psychrobacter sp. TaxID=56811 RepID=UPI0025D08AB6|nr:DUF1853 family protein [Psychrobacter sp.]